MSMRKADEARRTAAALTEGINKLADRPLRFMEVCGTHTVAIFKAGIRQLLPPQVDLISGPGCPVCVTPAGYLDTAIAYARMPQVIITTFGDMLRVPGSTSSLMREKASGADIRMVYSPLESLDIARENPSKKIVFLAVGFETTAPTAAATIVEARRQGLKNFFVHSAHKLVPPALKALLGADTGIDGFILPGNVSTIIGSKPYEFLRDEHRLPAVITGFEAMDILQSVYALAKQVHSGEPLLENHYRHIAKDEGNQAAMRILKEVYRPSDAVWRGMGILPDSGLELRDEYREFDIMSVMPVQAEKENENSACRCGEVLRGLIKPPECALFGKACTPANPIGACMVSVEGTCAAWYKYGAGRLVIDN